MAYLEYIKDKDLVLQVKKTLATYSNTIKSIDLMKFNSNIIDPIKLTFDGKVYDKGFEQIIIDEIARQRDKTNTNEIGYFHQNLFKYLKNCEVPKTGFDIIFTKEDNTKIFVELKNKHNTMNSKSAQKTYMKFLSKAIENQNNECYLVEIIAKKSQNILWKTTLDGSKVSNDRIRRVSIDKFYELVTGIPDSFLQLCKVLPKVLDDVLSESEKFLVEEDTVLEELSNINPDLLKALFSLAFSTYEGYGNIFE